MVVVENPQISEETILTISPAALTAMKHLQQEHQVPDHALRVLASSAGCSGVQYGMAFEAEAQNDDLILSIEGIQILLDPASLTHLKGISIDYVDSLTGAGFQIHQPKTVSGCGCSSSAQTIPQDNVSSCCS